jgi:hypothetical protein
MSVAKTFERIHKKAPTDADLRRIYEIGSAVGADDNDVFLSLIVALDYYHGIYNGAPGQIKQAVDGAVAVAMQEAQAKVGVLTVEAVRKASEAVQNSAQAAAKAASVRSAAQWIGGGLLACALAVSIMSRHVYNTAFETGVAAGKAEQRNEELYIQQRDSWLGTEEGRKAYLMSKNGELSKIINCEEKGWKIVGNTCSPQSFEKNVYGWRLP